MTTTAERRGDDITEPRHPRDEDRPGGWPANHALPHKAAHALAFYIRQTIRPEWSYQGIVDALAELHDQDPAQIGTAAIFCASNHDNRAPVRIAHLGAPHWEMARAGRRIERPDGIDYTPDCEYHPGVKATECADCTAKVVRLPPGQSIRRSAHFKKLYEWGQHVAKCEAEGTDPGPRPAF